MKPIVNWFKSFLASDPRVSLRHKAPPLVAYFWDGGCPVAHVVRNISSTGFYLETTERWLLGTLVMMTLQQMGADPSHPDCTVIVMSKVVRHGEDGVGFAFIATENSSDSQSGPISRPADRRTLDKFLHLLHASR